MPTATGKRFYWIKLRKTFIDSDEFDFLMSQKEGANYIVLYEMLCINTINSEGKMVTPVGDFLVPYDIPKIQRDCKWFSVDTIRIALELYKKLGWIYEDRDGVLAISKYSELVGSETDWAAKKRLTKTRQQLMEGSEGGNQGGNEGGMQGENFPPRDIEYKEYKSIESTKSIKSNTVRGEPASASPPEYPPEPPIYSLPLNDGSAHPVTQSDIENYASLYPAVDIEQEIRKMLGWLESNPTRRKTKRGIRNFITSWLSRQQDRAGGTRPALAPQQPVEQPPITGNPWKKATGP